MTLAHGGTEVDRLSGWTARPGVRPIGSLRTPLKLGSPDTTEIIMTALHLLLDRGPRRRLTIIATAGGNVSLTGGSDVVLYLATGS